MSAWMDDEDRRDIALVVGGLGPIAVASALVAVRGTVHNANVALVLVVVVVLAAALGGRGAGILAAATAALSFNFFHTRPYLRLTIEDVADIETTLLLLAVGLVVGHLAAGSRQARAFVTTEIRRIHRVAESIARGEDLGAVILTAEVELTELLRLGGCRFEAVPSLVVLPRLSPTGALDVREHRFSARGFELPAGGVELPVYGRGRQLGRFVLEPARGVGVSRDQRVLAVSIADQVGAALAVGAG